MTITKNQRNKWIVSGLLYGSILLFLIFYIVTMATGFAVPHDISGTDNIGFWITNLGDSVLFSYLSDAAVVCIVFWVISLGLLVSGLVLSKKWSVKLDKLFKISIISWCALFSLTIILALSAKPYSNPDFDESTLTVYVTPWIKFVSTPSSESSGYFAYTVVGVIVTIFLSLAVILPATYTTFSILKLFKVKPIKVV